MTLVKQYNQHKDKISSRIEEFKQTPKDKYFDEFMFCLLTPQSNAQKCWQAVLEIKKLPKINQKNIVLILSKKTRFHNNKSRYILQAPETWKIISPNLERSDIKELRNFISENVKGYGLKEAGHFLRNIGKSNNQIAILDRHILRNLKELEVINDTKIKNKKHYLEIEDKFLEFSKEVKIPIDHLDLLFWSKENGEIFK